MNREHETDVLVVGAGPVGMMTALVLAENGVQVTLIDKEERTAAHSHACALHPRSLRLLEQIGLGPAVLATGRRIDSIAFYEGESRQAELKLAKLSGTFPYLVVLPQSVLENLLEQRLRRTKGIKVDWNHRLADLELNRSDVLAHVEKLGESSKGYIVRDVDWEVQKSILTRAAFVVGADGSNSHVRQMLGIECKRIASPETYAVYEFVSDGNYENELRMVLDDSTTNSFWPLAGNRCRWTLQVLDGEEFEDSHAKERTDVLLVEQAQDATRLGQIREQILRRAPWFHGTITQLDWSVEVQFESCLANEFGRGRCWLAGDAAHQTRPIGMQSMNVGLAEAVDLADTLTQILRNGASMDLLNAYNKERQAEWQKLLAQKEEFGSRNTGNSWMDRHYSKILSCVPVTGEDSTELLKHVEAGVGEAVVV